MTQSRRQESYSLGQARGPRFPQALASFSPCHPVLMPLHAPLPNAPPSSIRVCGQHGANQRLLLVLRQPEVVERLLEVGGLIDVDDVDDNTRGVFGGAAAHVAEVDGGVCGLYSEAVLLDVFIVQWLWGKPGEKCSLYEPRLVLSELHCSLLPALVPAG